MAANTNADRWKLHLAPPACGPVDDRPARTRTVWRSPTLTP